MKRAALERTDVKPFDKESKKNEHSNEKQKMQEKMVSKKNASKVKQKTDVKKLAGPFK